jgi:hypothetical protein
VRPSNADPSSQCISSTLTNALGEWKSDTLGRGNYTITYSRPSYINHTVSAELGPAGGHAPRVNTVLMSVGNPDLPNQIRVASCWDEPVRTTMWVSYSLKTYPWFRYVSWKNVVHVGEGVALSHGWGGDEGWYDSGCEVLRINDVIPDTLYAVWLERYTSNVDDWWGETDLGKLITNVARRLHVYTPSTWSSSVDTRSTYSDQVMWRALCINGSGSFESAESSPGCNYLYCNATHNDEDCPAIFPIAPTIYRSTICGMVWDETGGRVNQGSVCVRPSNADPSSQCISSNLTDDLGAWESDALGRGNYTITFSLTSYINHTVTVELGPAGGYAPCVNTVLMLARDPMLPNQIRVAACWDEPVSNSLQVSYTVPPFEQIQQVNRTMSEEINVSLAHGMAEPYRGGCEVLRFNDVASSSRYAVSLQRFVDLATDPYRSSLINNVERRIHVYSPSYWISPPLFVRSTYSDDYVWRALCINGLGYFESTESNECNALFCSEQGILC